MAIFDLFSKRQKALRGEVPDVFTYDNLPNALRVQIVHIWRDALGSDQDYYNTYGHADSVRAAYKFIVDTLCREHGLFKLPTAEKYNDRMYLNELANYLLQVNEIEKQLDIIDLSFRYIDPFWQQQLSSLRSLLESSIPTGRNKLSGHGQGATPIVVPDYLVAYMLHMMASTLVFLTTAEKKLA